MASIGGPIGVAKEAANRVRSALTSIAASIAQIERARRQFSQAAQDSSRAEASHAIQQLGTSRQQRSDAYGAGSAALTSIEALTAAWSGHGEAAAPPPSDKALSAAPGNVPTPKTVPAHVEALRRTLPPDVPPYSQRAPGAPRPKTHGRWVDPSGQSHEAVSGRDEKADAAVQWFKSRGMRVPTTTTDVEIKVAVHLRINGITDATLIINNTPCVGVAGCDTLLPKILPEGYSVTVYGSDGFHKVYRGKGQ